MARYCDCGAIADDVTMKSGNVHGAKYCPMCGEKLVDY